MGGGLAVRIPADHWFYGWRWTFHLFTPTRKTKR